MQIGDRVRLISSTEEGVIVDFLPNGMIEVEIEDGFGIPVQKKDLVSISNQEVQYFNKTVKNEDDVKPSKDVYLPNRPIARKNSGIYVTYVPIGKNNYEISLVNNTDWQITYRILEYYDQKYTGIKAGYMDSNSYAKIGVKSTVGFDEWKVMVVDIMHFNESFNELPDTVSKRIKPKTSIFKNRETLPIIKKEGFKIQIDKYDNHIDPKKIKEQILSQTPSSSSDNIKLNAISSVDLHAETNDFSNDETGTILDKQLSLFHLSLDQAILNGNSEITYIHGVGNGILRQKIHKSLSGHPHVDYFKDTDKDRFGYGATLVKIK